MVDQHVIINDLTHDQKIRAKAMEISANIYTGRMLAAALSQNPQDVPAAGNPFLIARKIESYIRNDIISDPTKYFWFDKA